MSDPLADPSTPHPTNVPTGPDGIASMDAAAPAVETRPPPETTVDAASPAGQALSAAERLLAELVRGRTERRG